MMPSLPRLLVVGVSVRSLARSAIASGYAVQTADGYGDRDLLEPAPRPVRHLTLNLFEPDAIADRARLPADALAWSSGFENHPDALERLASGRRMIGNAPSTVRAVRTAARVQQVLEASGLPTAAVYAGAGEAAALAGGRDLVAKPERGGGGQGVRRWRPEETLATGELLQEWIDGAPASLVFVADGTDVTVLGLTRQLIGDPAFGAHGHRWCGNLLGSGGAAVIPGEAEVLASATAAAVALTRAFGLRGINGIDFIARGGTAVVVEVNPRWTGAVELAERARGASLFSAHLAGSEGRLLTSSEPVATGVQGKAVVFAPADWVAPDTDAWLADDSIRDVPQSGSAILAGAPICTVFACAPSVAACYEALVARSNAITGGTQR